MPLGFLCQAKQATCLTWSLFEVVCPCSTSCGQCEGHPISEEPLREGPSIRSSGQLHLVFWWSMQWLGISPILPDSLEKSVDSASQKFFNKPSVNMGEGGLFHSWPCLERDFLKPILWLLESLVLVPMLMVCVHYWCWMTIKVLMNSFTWIWERKSLVFSLSLSAGR